MFDCVDSFVVSYGVSDYCFEVGLFLISVLVVGIEGYVGGFCVGMLSLWVLFFDLLEMLGSCDMDGVFGFLVGVVGSL